MSNLKAASCAYSKNQILHMQIKSFETVIKFTKTKLTRNERQSRSASGNREALEEKQKTSTIVIWETRLLQLQNLMEFSCWLQNNMQPQMRNENLLESIIHILWRITCNHLWTLQQTLVRRSSPLRIRRVTFISSGRSATVFCFKDFVRSLI